MVEIMIYKNRSGAMFDNVNWNEFINNITSHTKKSWKYLIVKADISKTSYSANFYYSKNGEEFICLNDSLSDEKLSYVYNYAMPELMKITEKFKDHKERMFLTIKVENSGNVKVIYRDVREGNKIPWDESNKNLQLNENDKMAW